MPTISIDVTAPQASRLAAAFGKAFNLGRDATPGEVRSYLIDYMRGIVVNQERESQIQSIVVPALGVS